MSKFYKIKDANKLRFYQVPKVLVEGEKYSNLGLAEKLTYGVLLDRLQLSIKNNWADENGYIYFLFSGEKLGELLNVHEKTARKYIRNLINAGLAEEKRMGRGLTNKLYLIQPEHIESDIRKNIINEIDNLTIIDIEKYEKEQKVPSETKPISIEKYEKEQKVPSRRNERFLLEGTKSSPNDTNYKDTDFNDNLSIKEKENLIIKEIERLKEEKTKEDLTIESILKINNIDLDLDFKKEKTLIIETLKEIITRGINTMNGNLVKVELIKKLNKHNLWYSIEQFLKLKDSGEPIKYEKKLLGTYIINNLHLSEEVYDKYIAFDNSTENIY